MIISIHALRVEGDVGLRFGVLQGEIISIHALRVEGDSKRGHGGDRPRNFYPRPPGGGRRDHTVFQRGPVNFYPRPPGGGRRKVLVLGKLLKLFLSTPSGWRATGSPPPQNGGSRISIHALRVEGDVGVETLPPDKLISIHALRVEGDAR